MAYNLTDSYKIVTDASMASSITSEVIEVKNQDNIAFQFNFTGAPVGTFSVQVSLDYKEDMNGNVQNAGNWISLPLSPAITATGAADVAYVDINQTGATYMRVLYTRTSGTGVLNVYAVAKGV